MDNVRLEVKSRPGLRRCAWLALVLVACIGVAMIALPAEQSPAQVLISRRHWRSQVGARPRSLTRSSRGQCGAFDHLLHAAGSGSRKAPPRQAVVSILQDETHLASVLTLAFSLRQHGNVLPLVLFHNTTWTLSDTARDILDFAGWEMRTWERIAPFVNSTHPNFMDTCAPLVL